MKIVQTIKLTKSFDGINAIDKLSVGFEKGKIIGLIGPNGSGKSTLINVLSGIQQIDGGMIKINGIGNIKILRPYKVSLHGITRTFQNSRLFEQMTVQDNILVIVTKRNVFLSLFERQSKNQYLTTKKVLRRVGLWDKRKVLAINLSYGQRKLLEIARILAMNANIYLLDEPFAGLSPSMKKNVSDIIKELKEKNKTIVIVEHDIGIIRKLCEYVFVMDEGKLLAEGKPTSVLKNRKVVEAYLA